MAYLRLDRLVKSYDGRVNAVDGISVALAWAYVALRVIHSFVQATRNVIIVRFSVFAAASLTLLLLLVRTVLLLV